MDFGFIRYRYFFIANSAQRAEILSVGDKYTVGVESLPQGYVFTDLVWSSDNTACATVNSNGVVTAVSSDSAIITVTTSDGKFKASVIILAE